MVPPNTQSPKAAVVLLSGGLDSAVAAAIARMDDRRLHALTFRYGQRHAPEVGAASRVAQVMGVVEHVIQEIDLRVFGGSALTADLPVPKPADLSRIGKGIPTTYVPARNTIFLALGLALAETRRASEIFIGVNAVDYSGYPDCRPEYIEAFQKVADLATKAAVTGARLAIRAPLLTLSKGQIIRRGAELGVDFSLTRSCYDPLDDDTACGACDSCVLRLQGFREAGIPDPIRYHS